MPIKVDFRKGVKIVTSQSGKSYTTKREDLEKCKSELEKIREKITNQIKKIEEDLLKS